MKRVLLAGAGHAHAALLASLAKAPLYGARFTLVSPQARALYSGMVPGVIAGHYHVEEAQFDVAALAARAAVEFVAAGIESLDLAARSATLSDGPSIGYDLCSLNIGSCTPAPSHAVSAKPFGELVEKLRFASHVAVAGGGAAGAELAMALRHRGGEVTLYSEQSTLPKRVERALRRCRVDFRPGMRVDAVEEGPVVVSGSARQHFDLVLWATGPAAFPWLRASGLTTDEAGFVRVDGSLRSVSHPEVFALGDCAALGEPKAGVYAVRHARVLEQNLRNLVLRQPLVQYEENRPALMLLSCGRRYAIASRGTWSAQGRWVWWWKNWIDRGWIRRLAGR